MSIRVARTNDAAAVQAIYAAEVAHGVASFETEPPSIEEMAGRIARTLPDFPWLVWGEEGAILGYAYATRHRDRAAYRWSVDSTVYVAPDAHGRGVGRGLYDALLEILCRQGFHAVYAGITLPNAASEALHRACGFERVGVYREVGFKFGAWRDTCWMRKPLNDQAGQPAEPTPFADLRDQRRA